MKERIQHRNNATMMLCTKTFKLNCFHDELSKMRVDFHF